MRNRLILPYSNQYKNESKYSTLCSPAYKSVLKQLKITYPPTQTSGSKGMHGPTPRHHAPSIRA